MLEQVGKTNVLVVRDEEGVNTIDYLSRIFGGQGGSRRREAAGGFLRSV